MKPIYKQFPITKSGETFAGFSYPRRQWTLPRGPLAGRLAAAKKGRICGPYYSQTANPNPRAVFFYLGDMGDGAPMDLPWCWADELHGEWTEIARPGGLPSGYYCDALGSNGVPDAGGDIIRGVVFKLPKGRGYLAGWSMGVGMASEIDTTEIHGDGMDAALYADHLAEAAAERNREASALDCRARDIEEWREENRELWGEAKRLARDIRKQGAMRPEICATVRLRLRNIRTQIGENLREIAEAKRELRALGHADMIPAR